MSEVSHPPLNETEHAAYEESIALLARTPEVVSAIEHLAYPWQDYPLHTALLAYNAHIDTPDNSQFTPIAHEPTDTSFLELLELSTTLLHRGATIANTLATTYQQAQAPGLPEVILEEREAYREGIGGLTAAGLEALSRHVQEHQEIAPETKRIILHHLPLALLVGTFYSSARTLPDGSPDFDDYNEQLRIATMEIREGKEPTCEDPVLRSTFACLKEIYGSHDAAQYKEMICTFLLPLYAVEGEGPLDADRFGEAFTKFAEEAAASGVELIPANPTQEMMTQWYDFSEKVIPFLKDPEQQNQPDFRDYQQSVQTIYRLVEQTRIAKYLIDSIAENRLRIGDLFRIPATVTETKESMVAKKSLDLPPYDAAEALEAREVYPDAAQSIEYYVWSGVTPLSSSFEHRIRTAFGDSATLPRYNTEYIRASTEQKVVISGMLLDEAMELRNDLGRIYYGHTKQRTLSPAELTHALERLAKQGLDKLISKLSASNENQHLIGNRIAMLPMSLMTLAVLSKLGNTDSIEPSADTDQLLRQACRSIVDAEKIDAKMGEPFVSIMKCIKQAYEIPRLQSLHIIKRLLPLYMLTDPKTNSKLGSHFSRHISPPRASTMISALENDLRSQGILLEATGSPKLHGLFQDLDRSVLKDFNEIAQGPEQQANYAKTLQRVAMELHVARTAKVYVENILTDRNFSLTTALTVASRVKFLDDSAEEAPSSEAMPVQELPWVPLRQGEGEPRGQAPATSTESGREELTKPNYDWDRVEVWLKGLQDKHPGSMLYCRPLKPGKEYRAPDHTLDIATLKEQDYRDYIILVIPKTVKVHGREVKVRDVIATSPLLRHQGIFVWRGEQGLMADGRKVIDWTDVFQHDKMSASFYGAKRMRHINNYEERVKRYLEADYELRDPTDEVLAHILGYGALRLARD